MHIHPELTGLLIGRGGEKIKALCRETGAKIDLARNEVGTVKITGPMAAVDRAARAIEEILDIGGERRTHPPEHHKVIFVSGSFIGMIIGRGGESIKAMSRASGAKIEVSKDDRDADRQVTIVGTAEAVEKASQMIDDIVAHDDDEPRERGSVLVEPPPGFEECEHEDWLYNSATQEYFSKKTGALAWLSAGVFCPIREGIKNPLQLLSSACVIGDKAPKTVVIPDLHRVAAALKVPFDHVDSPSALLAVFGSGPVAPEVAARSFHEKLVKRIGAWRSAWLDQAWLGAAVGAMLDVAGGADAGAALPSMACAVLVGRKVVSVAAPGAHACLMAEGVEGLEAVGSVDLQGASCGFTMLPKDTRASVCMALLNAKLEDAAVSSAVGRPCFEKRPRAAALALARRAQQDGCKGSLATACARLGWDEENKQEKKLKPGELNKVRVRQILLRFWSGKGPQPTNPVTRKSVSRKVAEAELAMLEILEKLLAENCQNWQPVCKSSSECGSALRGGADNGDLGWLDQAKTAALAKAKGQPGVPLSVVQSSVPVAVVKAAFNLEKGELSDVVVSEIGVHLIQRTG